VYVKTLLSFCVYEQRLYHVFTMYVFVMHVNRSENQKINRFTALHQCVCAQKLSRAFVVYVCMLYVSLTCEYIAVFALCVIALHVNRSENAKNRSIYCITSVCMCAKAESCLHCIYVYVVYELQHVCKDIAVLLCICKLQCINDRVVIVLLFNCVWTQCMSKALLLLCQCWWNYSAFLTSIACRRFVVSILYK